MRRWITGGKEKRVDVGRKRERVVVEQDTLKGCVEPHTCKPPVEIERRESGRRLRVINDYQTYFSNQDSSALQELEILTILGWICSVGV